MQSYGDAPPPYPGINVQPSALTIVTSKGDYQGVPVYELGSNNAPVCKFCFSRNEINQNRLV